PERWYLHQVRGRVLPEQAIEAAFRKTDVPPGAAGPGLPRVIRYDVCSLWQSRLRQEVGATQELRLAPSAASAHNRWAPRMEQSSATGSRVKIALRATESNPSDICKIVGRL